MPITINQSNVLSNYYRDHAVREQKQNLANFTITLKSSINEYSDPNVNTALSTAALEIQYHVNQGNLTADHITELFYEIRATTDSFGGLGRPVRDDDIDSYLKACVLLSKHGNHYGGNEATKTNWFGKVNQTQTLNHVINGNYFGRGDFDDNVLETISSQEVGVNSLFTEVASSRANFNDRITMERAYLSSPDFIQNLDVEIRNEIFIQFGVQVTTETNLAELIRLLGLQIRNELFIEYDVPLLMASNQAELIPNVGMQIRNELFIEHGIQLPVVSNQTESITKFENSRPNHDSIEMGEFKKWLLENSEELRGDGLKAKYKGNDIILTMDNMVDPIIYSELNENNVDAWCLLKKGETCLGVEIYSPLLATTLLECLKKSVRHPLMGEGIIMPGHFISSPKELVSIVNEHP